MPDCKPFSLLCTKNFLALAGAFLVTIAQGGGGLSGGLRGMLGAADVGGARRGGLPALSPADLAVPESVGVACLLCRRLTLPLVYFYAPYPPSPLPLRGRGRPRLFHARGFAPCIPGAEPARHRLDLPLWYPAGACFRRRQFGAKPIEPSFYWQCRQPRREGTGGEELRRLRWSSPPGQVEPVPPGRALCEHEAGGWGAESKLKAAGEAARKTHAPAGYHSGRSSRQRRKQAPPPGAWFASLFQRRPGSAPGDARGEAPCIRKPKISPFPPGRGVGGWGQESKLKAGLVGGCPLHPPPGTANVSCRPSAR